MLKPVLRAFAASGTALIGAVCFLYLIEAVYLIAGWHMSPVAAWAVGIVGWVVAMTAIVWVEVRSLRSTDTTNLRRWVRWVAVAVMTDATVAVAMYMLVLALMATGALIERL